MNVVVVIGALSRPAEARTLPSGDQLVAFEVTVRHPERAAESVPVVWPDAPSAAADHPQGREVVVVGRVRRRFFRTPAGTGSRTEVVASAVLPLTQRKRVARVLAQVVTELTPSAT